MTTTNTLTAIPLNKLERHPGNVRKTTATGIAELAASIERDGLLQNLTVVDGTYNKGKHWVVAGGRRLAALQLLAKNKKLAADFPVPVRVVPAAEAEAVSLAENQMREAMHPIDQFLAFKAQVDANQPLADVAARFGVTETFVKQRLKLAAVSPELLEVYRAGKMTLEQLQAFTVTDNHERQVEVWDEVKDSRWGCDPDSIKDELLDDVVSSKDARVKFVGLKAYQKAGGAIIAADLFSDDASETVSDPELLDKMAMEKLQKHAAKIQKDEGLAWCDAMPTFSFYMQRDKYGRVPTVEVPMTDEQAKLHAELEEKLEALQKQLDSVQQADELDEALEDKLCAEMDELERQRDAIDEGCTVPHPDALEYAGAVVSIGLDGKLEVERNLIRQDDLKKLKPIEKAASQQGGIDTGSTEAEKPAAGGHSEKLVRRLTAHKTMILRHAMANSPTGEMALVTTVFHMLAEDLARDGILFDGCMTMHSRPLNRLETLADDIDGSSAAKKLAARESEVLGPIREMLESADSTGDDVGDALFRYLSPLPVQDLLAILSVCVANRLDVVAGHEGDGGKSHVVAKHMRVEKIIPHHWKATRANYFDHVSKAQIVDVVRENAGDDRAAFVAKMPKGEAAERAEELMQSKDWLPNPMRVSKGS